MKKFLSIFIIITLTAMLFGCGSTENKKEEEKVSIETGHTIYIREGYSKEIKAIFTSTESDATETVTLEKLKSGEDYNTYSCTGDTEKYDRVQFIGDDSDKSMVLVFNEYVNGYHLKTGGNQGNTGIPFVYDKAETEVKYETVPLKYGDTEKKIFIWTPEGYDKNDKNTKYSVIYMCDGQNLFSEYSTSYGCWNVAESVNSMMANSDKRCIIVGIDNGDGNRDNELTPNIGKLSSYVGSEFEDGTGEAFSNFVVKTVMPYINNNYNVFTDRENTSICGSSSGGIEAFYIGMEHPDKFNSIGALSPAFILFEKDVWNSYLKGIDFKGNYPFIYTYCGQGDTLEKDLYTGTKAMLSYLKNINYPQEKIVFKEYTEAQHNEIFWRAIFPEYLKYTFSLDKTTLKD